MGATPHSNPGVPPWETLYQRLLERAEGMRAAGDEAGAAVLHALVQEWWGEQQEWTEELCEALRANHEINNALVGVSGNVQLLLLSPTGREPGVKERLQTILREAGRVERAARGLQETKSRLGLISERPTRGDGNGGFDPHSR
jgi:signal transduction histidine kinase